MFIKAIFMFIILFIVLFPHMATADDKLPIGQMDKSQSFQTSFKYFSHVKFATFVDYSSGSAKVHFYLLRDSKVVADLPAFQTEVSSWTYEQMSAISFKDIDRDGLKDIIIMAYYVTGIGPTGMQPFLVKDVYFQTNKGFVKKESVSKLLNDSKHYQKLKTVRDIVKFLKDYK